MQIHQHAAADPFPLLYRPAAISHILTLSACAPLSPLPSLHYQICDSLVDGMITVDNDEICAAIKHCFNDTRSVLEPAGALGIAGTVQWLLFFVHLLPLGYLMSAGSRHITHTLLPLRQYLYGIALTPVVALVGMVKYAQQEGVTGKTMVAVTSGANMDFDRYQPWYLRCWAAQCPCVCGPVP